MELLCVSRKIAVESAASFDLTTGFWGVWVYFKLAVACSPLPSDVMIRNAAAKLQILKPPKKQKTGRGGALSTAIFRETHSTHNARQQRHHELDLNKNAVAFMLTICTISLHGCCDLFGVVNRTLLNNGS